MKITEQTKSFKAGIYYLIAEMVTRGISFFMTPIFTRLLPESVYADVKVFEAWTYLFAPIISFSVYQSVARAKFDFEDNYYNYVSSMLGFMVTATCFFGFLVFLFRNYILGILGFSFDLILLMFVYCLAYNSIQCVQMGERQLLHYQNNIVLTVLAVVPSVIISVGAVVSYKNSLDLNQLLKLRLYSFYIPVIIIGAVVCLIMFAQGKKFYSYIYWSYGIKYSAPMIFFALSTQVLYQSDKIMVKYYSTIRATAILALATTVGYIMDILVHAVDNAWRPWLYEKLYQEDFDEIENKWLILLRIICILSWCMVLLAPELVLFLGGKSYAESVWLIGPIVCGAIANFIMIGYIAIEQYMKKTRIPGIISILVAFLNIGLNYIFIQIFSYRVTAYTTVFCYLVAGLLNCIFVLRYYRIQVLNPCKTFFMWGTTFLLCLLSMLTYRFSTIIRFGCVLVVLVFGGIVYKDMIIERIAVYVSKNK